MTTRAQPTTAPIPPFALVSLAQAAFSAQDRACSAWVRIVSFHDAPFLNTVVVVPDRHAGPIQPSTSDSSQRTDRKPMLRLLCGIRGVTAVYLDGLEQKVLLDSFHPDGLDFGELPVLFSTSPSTCLPVSAMSATFLGGVAWRTYAIPHGRSRLVALVPFLGCV
jgi:hypothetical protein